MVRKSLRVTVAAHEANGDLMPCGCTTSRSSRRLTASPTMATFTSSSSSTSSGGSVLTTPLTYSVSRRVHSLADRFQGLGAARLKHQEQHRFFRAVHHLIERLEVDLLASPREPDLRFPGRQAHLFRRAVRRRPACRETRSSRRAAASTARSTSAANASFFTNSPLLVCVHNPVFVQFVLPVHTATGLGGSLPVVNTRNLLCPSAPGEIIRSCTSKFLSRRIFRAAAFWSRLRASALVSPFFFVIEPLASTTCPRDLNLPSSPTSSSSSNSYSAPYTCRFFLRASARMRTRSDAQHA